MSWLTYTVKNCQDNPCWPLFTPLSVLDWMIYYTIHLYIAELLSALTSINKKGNPEGFEGLSYKSYNHKNFTVSHFTFEDLGHRRIKMRTPKRHVLD